MDNITTNKIKTATKMRQNIIPSKPIWFKRTGFVLMMGLMFLANFVALCSVKWFNTDRPINQSSSTTINSRRNQSRKLIKESIQPFPIRDRKAGVPCVTDKNSPNGIYYVRIPRTSAKPASVTKRIAQIGAKSIAGRPKGAVCNVNDGTIPAPVASEKRIAIRDKLKSFLWTTVRHPARRAVSHYDMKLRLGDLEASDDNFINEVKNSWSYLPDVQLKFLLPNDNRHSNDDNSKDADEKNQASIFSILSEFDFIGVEERMNESLVALSMLLGLKIQDVVYEFSTFCLTDKPKWLTTNMLDYLSSSEWLSKQKGDYMLYDAANTALDLTIEQFNEEEFNTNVKEYETLLDVWSKVSSGIYGKPGCGGMFSNVDDAMLKNWLTATA